jgi:DNA mismatch repair protein MSH2
MIVQVAQSHLAKYAEMVEETIDLDQLEHHQFIIKPNYDENLQLLASEIEQVKLLGRRDDPFR